MFENFSTTNLGCLLGAFNIIRTLNNFLKSYSIKLAEKCCRLTKRFRKQPLRIVKNILSKLSFQTFQYELNLLGQSALIMEYFFIV